MNRDFVEMLSALSDHEVEYLVVGAHALAAHGHVRATKDLDVWIRPTRDNAARAHRALDSFGAPLANLSVDDLSRPGTVFQIGVAPLRIDVLTRIDGVTFDEAWPAKVPAKLGGVATFVLSREHLIKNKRACGRLQDLADVERLERAEED